MQEVLPMYQCAEHHFYRSRFGAISKKLPYALSILDILVAAERIGKTNTPAREAPENQTG